ncbi:response regulator transcription factor [Phyllobacterium sp. OV277]|uniref:LuxR C-terminal-related transcriptional regulator n=1 Tax=Phyllobacterium sp. OV277 TaxID=1882772 RepID=UPI00088602FC|nr:response regulator transcription factor [Phyllobacterium sp. OV277]SDP34588.1 two component transcriptional regulator, LuxR family [Phyllobacterium sp. OV277]
MENENSAPERILLADGQHLYREGLHRFIEQIFPDAEIREAVGFETLTGSREFDPDLIIIDFYCPDYDPVTTAKWLRGEFPSAFIILLAALQDRKIIDALLESGIDCHVSKFVSNAELTQILLETKVGSSALVLEENGRWGLTPRQRDVLDLLVKGMSNKEIARALKISPFTVSIHVSAVMHYLEVDSRTAAAAKAAGNGISQNHAV